MTKEEYQDAETERQIDKELEDQAEAEPPIHWEPAFI